MRRREALAGLGALSVLGAGGAVGFGVVDPRELSGDADTTVEPVALQRFDAPGSPPGTERVPEPGRVTYLSMFATWCTICQEKMDALGEAAAAVDPEVQFVSVTNEPVGQTVSRDDVVEWWVDHDGAWPVAQDDDGYTLTRRLSAGGVPYSFVFDADNRVTWSEPGDKDSETILSQIEQA
jgi:thiol-disulfide isomerase/thioredoxin